VFNMLFPIRDGLMLCIKKWKIKIFLLWSPVLLQLTRPAK
jgi:hypothetical protein